MINEEILLTFDGTHDAITAEQLLIGAGLAVRVMSLPSSIRAGCGICLRVAPRDLAAAEAVLEAGGKTAHGRYGRRVENGRSCYLPLKVPL